MTQMETGNPNDAYAWLRQDVQAYATRADGHFCECEHQTEKKTKRKGGE